MTTKVKLVSKMKDYPYIEIGDIGHIEGHINGVDNCPYIICVFGKHIVYASFYNIEVVELEEVKEEKVTCKSCYYCNDNVDRCFGTKERFEWHLAGHPEEVKEEKEWPQEGDMYWFVDSNVSPGRTEYNRDIFDRVRNECGNMFRTKQEAQKAADHIKKVLINKEWEK
jgi:hypothetical protein